MFLIKHNADYHAHYQHQRHDEHYQEYLDTARRRRFQIIHVICNFIRKLINYFGQAAMANFSQVLMAM